MPQFNLVPEKCHIHRFHFVIICFNTIAKFHLFLNERQNTFLEDACGTVLYLLRAGSMQCFYCEKITPQFTMVRLHVGLQLVE